MSAGVFVRSAVQVILKSSAIVALAIVGIGFLFWLASARPSDFYLRAGFRSGAIVSLWVRPTASENDSARPRVDEANMSLWINGQRLPAAFANFDSWLQEFSLVSEEVESMDQGQAYALPSVPLAPEDESDESELYAEEDPYDTALSNLIHDLWETGFLTVAGSLHLRVPFWAKPLSGWVAAASSTKLSPFVLDRLVDGLPLRSDLADIPSWLSALPFAEMAPESKDNLIHRLIVDLGGREIGELIATVCEMENMAEELCHSDAFEENPLLPLLYASEDFQVQLTLFYALRGDHLVWSNSRECLVSLLSQPVSLQSACTDQSNQSAPKAMSEFAELAALKRISERNHLPSAGVWMNHVLLKQSMQSIFRQLDEEGLEGASWFQDLLQTRVGQALRRRLQLNLAELAHRWPVWGAQIGYPGPNLAVLSTFVRHQLQPDLGAGLPKLTADKQFNFLNGLFHIWMGQPRSTSRLQESKSWERVQSYWRIQSEYRIGWSEQE